MLTSVVWHFLQCVENPIGAGIDGNRRTVAPEDHSVAVDDEQRPFANTLAFAIRAVGLCGGTLWVKIGQQREVQAPRSGVGFMTPDAIDRDAQQFGPRVCGTPEAPR